MTSAREDPNRLVGTVLGSRFQIKSLIASDEAGVRYDAFDMELGSAASVRVLSSIRPDDSSLRKLIQLLTEVSALNIGGIKTLRAVGRTRERDVYYATDAVLGESLAERLSHGRILAEEAVAAIAGAGEVLAQVHRQGVIHGALHPGAVVVPPKGSRDTVQLLDFGLGPLAVSMNLGALGGSSASTPYQSPEQAKGEPFDHRADVYALGALLYEAITGRPPFAGQSAFEVLALQLRGEAPSLSRGDPRFEGSPLQQVIDTSMQVRPNNRYPSMQAMVIALRRAGREEATRKVRLGGPRPAPSPATKKGDKPAAVKAKAKAKPGAAPSAKRGRAGKKAAEPRPSLVRTVAVISVVIIAGLGVAYLMWRSLPPLPEEAPVAVVPQRPERPPPETSAPEPEPDRAPRRRPSTEAEPGGKAVKMALAQQPEPLDPQAVDLIQQGNKALLDEQFREAVNRFKRAKRYAPDSPTIARGLGMAYLKQGKRLQAARELRRYLELDPSALDRRRIEMMLRDLEQ